MKINIAIDGPSGAGKSVLAKGLAKKYGLIHVDTGALYRAIGLYMYRNGIDKADKQKVTENLKNINLELKFIDNVQCVILNGENVNDYIRTPEISMYASAVSAIPEVRQFLLNTQRNICKKGGVVMDGRDIGTVIMPDADVKIFLVASVESRAQRRYEELIQKGLDVKYEDVLNDIIKRDENDRTREIAPAVAAPDAVVLDNSGFTPEQSLAAGIEIVENALAKTK